MIDRENGWVGPKAVRISEAGPSVTLRINKGGAFADGTKRYQIAFYFYKGEHEKITCNLRMMYQRDTERDRIYFAQGSEATGYKLTPSKTGTYCKFVGAVDPADYESWEKAKGSYNLLYDKEEKLYYIDLNRRQ